jgi:hypothetical protein
MNYVITYDLHKRRVYTNLYNLMAAWKATRLAESVWLVWLNCDAKAARDFVAKTLDNDDTLIVVEVKSGSDWATLRATAAANAALSTYITPSKMAA